MRDAGMELTDAWLQPGDWPQVAWASWGRTWTVQSYLGSDDWAKLKQRLSPTVNCHEKVIVARGRFQI